MGGDGVPQPRHFGRLNGRGLWTLYRRGMQRYFRFGIESIGAPIVSSFLLLTVFVLGLQGRADEMGGVPLASFVAPGIVVLTLSHAAFEGAAFPILYDKLEGMIGDIVVAPLSALEILSGYVLPAATAGCLTGLIVVAAMSLFVEWPAGISLLSIWFAVLGALLFALSGMLIGLWADKWEHYAAAETFLMMPLMLLSGTFYSIEVLPEIGRDIIAGNPMFYLIDGVRAGLIGRAESDLAVGGLFLLLLCLGLGVLLWRLLECGYKIRS